jgi:asparagine synthetase B (glutamine-hydrolysing)
MMIDGGGGPTTFRSVTDLEFAAGWVPGLGEPIPLDTDHPEDDPLTALERLVGPALEHRPCVVGFSGGRDSSLILAAALRVARREGLDDPVPVTKRYPAHPETDESAWQELVVRHLGVREWVVEDYDDEFDLLGEVARSSLRRHGLVWPATVHNRAPQLAVARGGTYLGGEGGDEVLGGFRAAGWVALRTGALRPGRTAARELAAAFGPSSTRGRLLRRTLGDEPLRPWLQPEAQAWYEQTVVDDLVRRPMRYRAALAHHLSHRAVQTAMHNLHAAGRVLDVTYVQPLVEPSFAAALARHGPRLGYSGRTAAMQALFSDLLPPALLARNHKATFNSPYAGRHTRDFIARWDGHGLDSGIVDVEALRDLWSGPVIHGGTFQLVQAAWLATEGTTDRPGAPGPIPEHPAEAGSERG